MEMTEQTANAEKDKKRQEKKRIRKEILARVALLSEQYCETADEKIKEIVCTMEEYRNARAVFCYVGTEREINTRPLLERILEDGKILAVPRCIGRGVMKACRITDLSILKPGTMGILEPPLCCEEFVPEQLDLALVPCLTCSREGVRLGYGGGFYDRYLRKTEAFRACLVRSKLIEEAIPEEAHDLKMNAVITEEGRWNLSSGTA